MSRYDKKTVDMDCPGCKKIFEVTYYDICSRREAKCRKCGTALKFDFSAANNVQFALKDLERAEDKLEKAMKDIYKKMEITVKR